jgi:hypothetical protein
VKNALVRYYVLWTIILGNRICTNKWMTEIKPTKISYSSFGFVGNALIFYRTTGEPFSFTYGIDASVKNMKPND